MFQHRRIITDKLRSATSSRSHDFLSAPVEDAAGERTRPNLKIQDGCNNRCSFCIIPYVRGRSRSAPAEQRDRSGRSAGKKYREVVLSGINLGRWGRDFLEKCDSPI